MTPSAAGGGSSVGTPGTGALTSAWTGTPVVPEAMSAMVVAIAPTRRLEKIFWCILIFARKAPAGRWLWPQLPGLSGLLFKMRTGGSVLFNRYCTAWGRCLESSKQDADLSLLS